MEPLEARDVPSALGELDPTYGTGGTATFPAGLFSFGYTDAAIDPAGGRSWSGTRWAVTS
jgi:hypothetical protein